MKAVRIAAPLMILATACGTKQEAAPVYQAVPLQTRDISVVAEAAGAILADTLIDVKSKASGEILTFPVQTGDVVRRGDILARIDRRIPENDVRQREAQLEVAQAQLRNAETNYERMKQLYEGAIATKQEFENAALAVANAKTSVISAEIALENSKIALEDTEVRAPIGGTIITKNVERGAVITSPGSGVGDGTVLLRMADLSLVQVRTYVDQTDIGKIRPGLPATVTVEAYPNRPFMGEVFKIEPKADTIQNVTMFAVLVRIDNREGLLRPGMSSEVKIDVGHASQVLAVPNAALRTDRDVVSAASVLGIDENDLREMLEASRQELAGAPPPSATAGDTTARQALADSGARAAQQGGQQRQGQTGGQMQRGNGAGMTGAAGSRPGAAAGMRRSGNGAGSNDLFGARYIVFTMRGGKPTPVYVNTGITDLDWSEVRSGLKADDTVLLLPSAGLIQSQQNFQNRMQSNSGLPGQSSGGGSNTGGSSGGGGGGGTQRPGGGGR